MLRPLFCAITDNVSPVSTVYIVFSACSLVIFSYASSTVVVTALSAGTSTMTTSVSNDIPVRPSPLATVSPSCETAVPLIADDTISAAVLSVAFH